MNIEFGAWQLRPTSDGLNWQLWHQHKTKNGKNAGAVKWHATGRFYQYGSLDQAVLYAADCDAKERKTPAPVSLVEFAREHRAFVTGAVERIEAAAREIKAAQG